MTLRPVRYNLSLYHRLMSLQKEPPVLRHRNCSIRFILDVAGQPVEMKVNVPNDDFWFNELEFVRR